MHASGHIIANRYEVLGQLGSGGQGEVYRVRDHHEGDEVALKILDPASFTPLGPWAEAQILRRLADHHILPIRNAFTQLGVAMIVTDIAQNGTVADRISAEPRGLDVHEAVRWTRQACQALTRAHDLGLVHNDIKPANLFLTDRNDCRVGDFGFAGLISPTTGLAHAYGGTFTTMAPEVAATWTTTPTATVSSDVYSIAASTYWMLAGEPPHDLSACVTKADVIAYLSSSPARRLRDVAPHVPDTIARAIDRALAMDTADRPESPHQLSAALGRRVTGRRWRRTDEHAGHIACWRGAPPTSGSTYVLCMTAGTRPTQRLLRTVHAQSGRAVPNGAASATRATWPVAVRRIMRDVS